MRAFLVLVAVAAALAATAARAAAPPVAEIVSARLDGSDARSLSGADALRAQSKPASQIFSARLDGSDVRSLSGSEQAASGAMPAPGRRIAFVRGDGTHWLMNQDGGDQRQVAIRRADGFWGPAWSPDGRTVAFTRWDESSCTPSSRNCAISELVLADVESGSERRALRSRYRGIGSMSWSPDGSRLAYAGELSMNLGAHTVETIRADGTGRRVVLRLPVGSSPGLSQVGWSPRGDRIVYQRGQWLWLVRPQGGASTRLVRGNAPVWSPRGDKLLFVSIGEDRVSALEPATRRVRVLGRWPEASVSTTAWSPDGRLVAFEVRSRGVSTVSVVRVGDGRRLHSWSPGGDVTSLFFTRDGSRLVYTLLSS